MAKPSLSTHPKFMQLSEDIGGDDALALGSLEFLWQCGYQTGDPFIGDARAVERAARWRAKDGRLCAALAQAKFIDDNGDGTFSIHDLLDHAPKYVKDRLRKRLRRRKKTPKKASTTHKKGVTDAQNPSPFLPLLSSPLLEEEEAGGGPVLEFPVVKNKGKPWPLTGKKLAEYVDTFPGIDVLAECRKARQWCLDNPRSQKTPDGMPRFLSGWLSRAQNAGARTGPPARASPKTVDEIIDGIVAKQAEASP